MPNKKTGRRLCLAAIFILYAVALDFWNWTGDARIWGFPQFLFYIFGIQFLLTVCFFILARYYWPEPPEDVKQDKELT